MIVIKFSHTDMNDSSKKEHERSKKSEKSTIDKPSDIYHHFPHLFKPKSILKKSSSLNQNESSVSFNHPTNVRFNHLDLAVSNQDSALVSSRLENIESLPQVGGFQLTYIHSCFFFHQRKSKPLHRDPRFLRL